MRFFLFAALAAAEALATAQPQALIVCYSVDPIVEKACKKIEAELSACEEGKFLVRRVDSPTPEQLATYLKESRPRFPSHMPVFVVGHGGTGAVGEHYIALRKFWSEEEGPVTSEKFLDPKNTVHSPKITEAIENNLKTPATWYMSCHSGGTCSQGRNVGASCKSWETTSLTGAKFGPISGTNPLDAATRQVIRLLCERSTFAKLDAGTDLALAEREIRAHLEDKFDEGVSCFMSRADTQEEQEKVLKMIASQLSEGSTITDSTLEKKGEATYLKVGVCQQDCLSGGYWGKKKFSPNLKNFWLYSPSLQQMPDETAELQSHARPTTEVREPEVFPSARRRHLFPRLRERRRDRPNR